jgi:hypothetical protein
MVDRIRYPPKDNLAGLNIGQRFIREETPEFMAKNYGYGAVVATETLEFLSFEWNPFDSKEGTSNCDGVRKKAAAIYQGFL